MSQFAPPAFRPSGTMLAMKRCQRSLPRRVVGLAGCRSTTTESGWVTIVMNQIRLPTSDQNVSQTTQFIDVTMLAISTYPGLIAVETVCDKIFELFRHRRPFDITAAQDFLCDIFGDVGGPVFERVEGEDADRVGKARRHQIGDDRIEVRPLDGIVKFLAFGSLGIHDQIERL